MNRRRALVPLALVATLAAPAAAGAVEPDPRFDVDRVREALADRGEPFLVGGAVVGNRVVVLGSAGSIVLYRYGPDGVPRGAVPFDLGEFAFADRALFDRAAATFLIAGRSEGDLFVARGRADEPRTLYQTSIARERDVRLVDLATDGARDYVALDRPGAPPELFALSATGRPLRAFGAGGRRVLSGLRHVTALAVAEDGGLLVGVLRPDFTTRLLRVNPRSGAVSRGADIEDVSALRGLFEQDGRLFAVTSARDGLERLLELDPVSFEVRRSRRLALDRVVLGPEPGGAVTICGRSQDDVATCRRLTRGRLGPPMPLDWGEDATPVAVAVGRQGSPVVVGRQGRESRLAVGRDLGTAVRIAQSDGRSATARGVRAALLRALRSGRLTVLLDTPEPGRVRVRLRLGRRVLDVRTARASDGGARARLRLGSGDRGAISRARAGAGRARLEIDARMTDAAGNVATDSVRAVLP